MNGSDVPNAANSVHWQNPVEGSLTDELLLDGLLPGWDVTLPDLSAGLTQEDQDPWLQVRLALLVQ